MSEGTQTEKNYLYSFCCGYYIKYSNPNKTVFAGPQLNFNCGPAKTVRIVTIRTIRNIGLTLLPPQIASPLREEGEGIGDRILNIKIS